MIFAHGKHTIIVPAIDVYGRGCSFSREAAWEFWVRSACATDVKSAHAVGPLWDTSMLVKS